MHTRPRQLAFAEAALQHAGTCSRRRRRLGMCMHAGLARPNLQALPSLCFTFLGLHFKKSDLSFFWSLRPVRIFFRSETRAAGNFSRPHLLASLFFGWDDRTIPIRFLLSPSARPWSMCWPGESRSSSDVAVLWIPRQLVMLDG